MKLGSYLILVDLAFSPLDLDLSCGWYLGPGLYHQFHKSAAYCVFTPTVGPAPVCLASYSSSHQAP